MKLGMTVAALIAVTIAAAIVSGPLLAQGNAKPVPPRTSAALPETAVATGPARSFATQARNAAPGEAMQKQTLPERTASPRK